MSEPLLRIQNVDAGYGGRRVLRDVSVEVHAGQRVGLLGPNGGGKSTLFRVALGLLAPWRGSVVVLGGPPGRASGVAYVPQARQLDPAFPVSARDVVLMGRVGGPFRWPSADDRRAADEALVAVDLGECADAAFGTLSGGQQQRVLVARALAADARLLLLDEPATGVDAETRARLDALIARLVAEGRAVLASTHDLSTEQLGRFDRVVCLNEVVVAEGPPEAVTTLDVWRRLFGTAA